MSRLTIVNNPSADLKDFLDPRIREISVYPLFCCVSLSKEIQLNNCIETVTMVELPPQLEKKQL